MAIQLESENAEFDSEFFQQNLSSHYRILLKSFKKTSYSLVLFHFSFLLIFILQIGAFISFFTTSTMVAILLGGIFLSVFSYFILLFYFQAKKPEQRQKILKTFVESARKAVGLPEGTSEHHLSIAHAAIKLFTYLHGFEKGFYGSKNLKSLRKLFESFSSFCHFEDVFQLKKMLLKIAIDEHIKQIHMSPTDLEVHASLANTYVLFSRLYSESQKTMHRFLKIRFKKLMQSLEGGFQDAAQKALEEFTIIYHYAPDDPWIHMQLAQSYRALSMFEKEIEEYEAILKMSPLDQQVLFRLGMLYFEHGQNAKGLQIYEELKRSNLKKAEQLIVFYGAS